MSTQLATRAGPSWRAVILVLAGMLVGLLVGQSELVRVVAGRVTPAATTAKWASCPSTAFYPRQVGDQYHTILTGRVGASERLYCGLTLPHGATITAVKFHLYDDWAIHQIYDCALVRIKLEPVNPPDDLWKYLAFVNPTGVPFDGGYVTKTDISIDSPVVNNRYYAYLAQCRIEVDSTSLRIIGVSVRYTPA